MIPQVDLLRITIDQQVSGQDSLLVSVFNLHKPGNHTQEGSASNVAPEPLRAKDSMLQVGSRFNYDQDTVITIPT